MQCGVACLAMIANYFGINSSLDEVEEICVATAEGVSLKGISDGAQSLGMRTMSVKATVDQLVAMNSISVLHWKQNHFVVLYHIDKAGKRFWIADPARGKYRINKEQLRAAWVSTKIDTQDAGIALYIPRAENASYYNSQHKKNNVANHNLDLRFLWRYIVQYKHFFGQILLALFVGCVLQLLLPYATQIIVDKGIGDSDIKLIWMILLGEVVIILGRASTDFIRRWLSLHISMRINISLISDFFVKLLKLPMRFFDTRQMGDLMQRMADHTRVQKFLTGQIWGTMFSLVSFIVLVFLLLTYDAIIFTVFLGGSIMYIGWILIFLNRRRMIDYELFEQQAVNNNRTYQFLSSLIEIKLQNCEDRRRWEWEDAQAELFETQTRALRLQQVQEAGSIFINETKNIFITVIAAYAVIEGNISFGVMMAIQYIVGQLNSPIEQFMNFILAAQDVKISFDRINEIHLRKDEDDCQKQNIATSIAPEISFSNVNFKYDKHNIYNTLDDINLRIAPSTTTAIVGASGSGKSTLIKLMLGFYPITQGKITVNGISLNDVNHRIWRSISGVVTQDSVIFSDTIARNIVIKEETIDEERMKYAASMACIDDYIESLPLGYNTLIGPDGVGISQGQRQRILIARAIYKNPVVIFFDEATNALDSTNEKKIMDNLNKFYEGRTVIIAAHRLSTVRNADQIIVLQDGKIAEKGKHGELISRKGIYYNLVKNQIDTNL